VKRDPLAAFRLYREAAAQGSPDGLYDLARSYDLGIGTAANQAQADRFYKEAVKFGSEEAKRAIALRLQAQTAVPGQKIFEQGIEQYKAKNIEAAVKLFRQAADAGNPFAQVQMGYQYEFGQGVPKDPAQAFQWYSKAAAQGNSVGQKNLGQMHEMGSGTPENWAEAVKWYQKSADQGDAMGQFALGRMYEFGMGVPQNRATAISWFTKAAAQGHTQAGYSAKLLSEPKNPSGFRDENEQNMVTGGRADAVTDMKDPAGRTFKNSAARLGWLSQFRKDQDVTELMPLWKAAKATYDKCMKAGGKQCYDPGPAPQRQ
jgi:TPR repeat protein